MTKKNGTARHVRISKYLSKHLRHQPERLGLELATGGWVDVDRLLTACARHGFPISRAELEAVVASDDKQRFSVDEHGTRIRANQGHSVEVELELEPAVPPAVLYHGTGHGAAELIVKAGIRRMARHHVHLSPDVTTATTVGSRHGQPVVFEVDAGAMHRAGHTFYLSSNGVWLVDVVPPQYVRRLLPYMITGMSRSLWGGMCKGVPDMPGITKEDIQWNVHKRSSSVSPICGGTGCGSVRST